MTRQAVAAGRALAPASAGGCGKARTVGAGSTDDDRIARAGCNACHVNPPEDESHLAQSLGVTDCVACHAGAIDAAGVPSGTGHVVLASAGGPNGGAACNGCHGDAGEPVGPGDPRSAPPRDAKGLAASPGVGAHRAGGALAAPIACAECHLVPLSPEAAGHLNGSVEILFGSLATRGTAGAAAPSYDAATKTCSNVYCHGNFGALGNAAAPRWNDGPSGATCGSCHGIPPPDPASGRWHSIMAGNPDLDCSDRHGAAYGKADTVNPATHVDGRLDKLPLGF